MINDKKMIYADVSLALIAFVWGGGFVAVKDALDSITPFYIMAIRFTLAAFLMGIVFWKKVQTIKKNDLIAGCIIGVFLFLGFAAQTVGLQYTTAGKQAFLTGTYVVMVPFLTWAISKKRPDGYSIIAAFLLLIGIAFLTLNGDQLYINKGDSLTLLCAVFFAAQIVAIGYFAKSCEPVVITIIQLAFAGVVSSVFAFVLEPVPQGIGRETFYSIGYLVVFSTMLAFFVQNIAQKYTNDTHAAILLCLESVFGSVLAVIFLGDVFTHNMIIGCTIIFIAIIISETKFNFLRKPVKQVV